MVIPLIVFIIGCIITISATSGVYHFMVSARRTRAQALADSHVQWFHQVIQKRIDLSDTLSALIYQADGDIEAVAPTIEKIYQFDGDMVSSFQLAPDGKVSYIYPEKGNEAGYIDLLKEPDRKVESLYAKNSKHTIVVGPLVLRQGGEAIIIRNPVYDVDESGSENFWGFTIVIANMDTVFKEANLDNIVHEGYEYRLIKRNDVIGDTMIVAQSSDWDSSNAESSSFSIPGYTMTMYLEPIGGWSHSWGYVVVAIMLSGFTVLTTLLARVLLMTMSMNRVLTEVSVTDSLTGVRNRFSLRHDFDDYRGQNVVVMMLDIDDFKQYNDNYGHEIGDAVLQLVAERLSANFMGDKIYRYGGDEFLVISTVGPAVFAERVEALRQDVRNITLKGVLRRVTISVGFVYGNCRENEDLRNMLKEADAQLYVSKNEGKDRISGKAFCKEG